MTIESILKLPYVMFVIGMLDAPSVDYGSKDDEKKKEKKHVPKTKEEEINALLGVFK